MTMEMGENKMETKRQLISEQYSLLREALIKLEEKIGPVTFGNIVSKTSGLLTIEEANILGNSVVQDREGGVNSEEKILEHAEQNPDFIDEANLDASRHKLEVARTLLEKLSS